MMNSETREDIELATPARGSARSKQASRQASRELTAAVQERKPVG